MANIWKEIPTGGRIESAGNAKDYKTGGWRNFRPIRDEKKCIHCLFCFIYCPDSAVEVEEQKMTGFDYDHCKGCGICANQCPVKCIEMKSENELREEA